MVLQHTDLPRAQFIIALVDGNADARRDRQLMLRAEDFDVRSYGSNAALLADSHAYASACIIADTGPAEGGGAALFRQMRAEGWRGRAILLREPAAIGDDTASAPPLAPDAVGTIVLPRSIADRPLLQAVTNALGAAYHPR